MRVGGEVGRSGESGGGKKEESRVSVAELEIASLCSDSRDMYMNFCRREFEVHPSIAPLLRPTLLLLLIAPPALNPTEHST